MLLKEFLKLKKENLKGKIVCFPTDTVYGVGCLLEDDEACEKIYKLKERDFNKPLATLVPNIDEALKLVNSSSINVNHLMNKYWPGALTIIFDKKEGLAPRATNNLPTIGLRMPNSKIALAILNHFGPMATTSVNISGQPPLNNLKEIQDLFKGKIDYYIEDKEESMEKLSSTVVKVSGNTFEVLRQGGIMLNNEHLKVSLGSDHAGYLLKEKIKKYLLEQNYEVIDCGTNSLDSVDYPDYAEKACKLVSQKDVDFGILVCFTGIGMSMAANKVKGVRAALISNGEGCTLTRQHNNANVLCLGAKFTTVDEAKKYVDIFLTTEFLGGRHLRRVNKVMDLEK